MRILYLYFVSFCFCAIRNTVFSDASCISDKANHRQQKHHSWVYSIMGTNYQANVVNKYVPD